MLIFRTHRPDKLLLPTRRLVFAEEIVHHEKLQGKNMNNESKPLDKTPAYLGVPWENAYGYPQAVKSGRTIYISGQLSHDTSGNLIAPAPLDAQGHITDASNMEIQMRATYDNAKRLLAQFGATLDHVVEETLYVTDVDAAFAVAASVRKSAYEAEHPVCASTLCGVTRLAFPQQLVEISFTAVLPD